MIRIGYCKTRMIVLVFALHVFLSAARSQQNVAVSFQSDPGQSDFGQVSVLMPEWSAALQRLEIEESELYKVLSVYVGEQKPPNHAYPAILGNYYFSGDRLIFQPRFAPPPGISYTVIFRQQIFAQMLGIPANSELPDIIKTFSVDKVEVRPTTIIEKIFPTTTEVPSNLLKVYIQFSQSMGHENPYEFIKLLTMEGEEVMDPFVEVTEGLWDGSKKRLTVFFHPGRIKRGVGPNMTMGEVFEQGKTYQLKIDENWKDIRGLPLRSPYQKYFKIKSPDRQKIDVSSWSLQLPQAGTREQLDVFFGEPLDHSLLSRMIGITDHQGLAVKGVVSAGPEESSWSFKPGLNWLAGKYEIVVDSRLEDLAGNNLISVFDREIDDQAATTSEVGRSNKIVIEIK